MTTCEPPHRMARTYANMPDVRTPTPVSQPALQRCLWKLRARRAGVSAADRRVAYMWPHRSSASAASLASSGDDTRCSSASSAPLPEKRGAGSEGGGHSAPLG